MDELSALGWAEDAWRAALDMSSGADMSGPSSCKGWSIGDLISHVNGGGHRYLLLISHAPSAAVEATRHQDYVRPHPLAHFDEYEIQLSRAFADRTRWEERVSHRAGPRRIRSLLLMRELDLSLHAWDLLDSIDAPASVNDDLAAFSLAEAAPVVEELRALELYGPASLGPTDGAGERLIALSGRSSPTRQS